MLAEILDRLLEDLSCVFSADFLCADLVTDWTPWADFGGGWTSCVLHAGLCIQRTGLCVRCTRIVRVLQIHVAHGR